MNIKIGTQVFYGLQIPILWGERAILQDKAGLLSVIDLGGTQARFEIIADEPAPDVSFRPQEGGFTIIENGIDLYSYDSTQKSLTGASLRLPSVAIAPYGIVVGGNLFSHNTFVGRGVGLAISNRGVQMGAALPPNLAKLTF